MGRQRGMKRHRWDCSSLRRGCWYRCQGRGSLTGRMLSDQLSILFFNNYIVIDAPPVAASRASERKRKATMTGQRRRREEEKGREQTRQAQSRLNERRETVRRPSAGELRTGTEKSLDKPGRMAEKRAQGHRSGVDRGPHAGTLAHMHGVSELHREHVAHFLVVRLVATLLNRAVAMEWLPTACKSSLL